MFAAHFATGLAIAARARRAPLLALLVAAFLPDLVWIALAYAGVEPTGPSTFFDGWSHSCISMFTVSTAFALCFARKGSRVWIPVWAAGMSHAVLDGIIHPTPLSLYPHAALAVPWNLWPWGSQQTSLGFSNYWWLQFVIVDGLLGAYAVLALRSAVPPHLVAATTMLVLGLHLTF